LRLNDSRLSQPHKKLREAKAVPRPGEVAERAFLVGIEYRTKKRGGKPSLTAGLQAARDGASGAASASAVPPSVPEFSAEESLDELKTLATSAGAEIAGEFLQRRDRPDPATLIGKGKLEEIAGAAASVEADLILFAHDLTASQQRLSLSLVIFLFIPLPLRRRGTFDTAPAARPASRSVKCREALPG